MARIGPGVRNKPRMLQDSCADCGATGPEWASVNRGILICDECCSVHRSLGRHITHVKSLKKSLWHSAQLAMVQTLNSSGANHIWEHTLLDPSTAKGVRRKPQPSDPVHPNKADFIRAKHQLMSFVYRPNREENTGGDRDVSRQLHASVRTANLETSLRLLSLGADPNYFSIEKGNCPIHVAATAGQGSQVELLVTYGADPGALDTDGLSSADYAREGGFPDIVERIVELQYEVTDRLAYYLCGKKPDHNSGQHWIVPDLLDPSSLDVADISNEARSKLIALPNHSFEELTCDVFDEVDRRETDAIWLSLENESALLSDRCSVPFLPVNPEYSSTRNQGRQKLARFNAREFATLIIDILIEARRRMVESLHPPQLQMQEKDKKDVTVTPPPSHHSHYTLTNVTTTDRGHTPHRQTCPSISSRQDHQPFTTTTTSQSQPILSCLSTNLHPKHHCVHAVSSTTTTTTTNTNRPTEQDEDPLYDSVASEDDYSSWERKRKMLSQQEILAKQNKAKNLIPEREFQDVDSLDYEDIPDPSVQFNVFRDSVSSKESPERKPKEREGTATVSLNEYLEMKKHLELSESRIKELQDNNIVMSAKLNALSTMIHTLKEENDCLRHQGSNPSLSKGFTGPPTSSYFPPTSPHHNTSASSSHNRSYSPFYDSPTHSFQNGDCNIRMGDPAAGAASVESSPSRQQRPYSMFEVRGRAQQPQSISTYSDNVDTPYVYDTSSTSSKGNETQTEIGPSLIASLPSQDEVVRKTEVITKRIQELLLAAQDSQHERFIPCAEHISLAVRDMADLFPKNGCPPDLRAAVHQLVMNAARLQGECRSHVTSQLHVLDPGRVTQQVIQCAYDIAKAAKNLVTHFQ